MRKSLLKTVVATAIVGAVMTVSSVVAMAGTTKYELCNQDGTNTKKSDDTPYFSSDFKDLTSGLVSGAKITKLDGKPLEIAKAYKIGNDIKFTSDGEAELTVVWAARTDKDNKTCKLKVDGVIVQEDNADVVLTKTSGLKTSVITGLKAGAHTIGRGDAEMGIYYVMVADTVDDSAVDYTLTGSCNVPNATITVDGVSTTTDANGAWTITKKDTSVPFGDTVAVSISQYETTTPNIKVSAGSNETTFTTPYVTFTKIALTALENKTTYNTEAISAGRPKFDIDNLNNNSGKYVDGSVIKFELSDPAHVTIKAKTGSTGAEATLTLSGTGYTQSVKQNDSGNTTEFLFEDVPAGEITLTLTSAKEGGDGTIVVSSIKAEYLILTTKTYSINDFGKLYVDADANVAYLVAEQAIADLNNANKMTIEVGGKTFETTTVYKQVEAGTKTHKAADGNYCYGVKIEEIGNDINVQSIKNGAKVTVA